MQICGYQKTTLLDFPGCVAATVFTGSCNFSCPFCHNRSLVINPANRIEEGEIFQFLEKRRPVLSGICISGGEPTLQEDLIPFLLRVRSLGYRIKLDTNGYLPQVLKDLIDQKLLDYIAMDIKSGHCTYPTITGRPDFVMEPILASVKLIENSGIGYEFRTTVVKEFHTADDFLEIADMLSSSSPYYLQSFRDSGSVLMPGLHAYNPEEMRRFLDLILPKLPKASIRGL